MQLFAGAWTVCVQLARKNIDRTQSLRRSVLQPAGTTTKMPVAARIKGKSSAKWRGYAYWNSLTGKRATRPCAMAH
jgi:hypothetical protein